MANQKKHRTRLKSLSQGRPPTVKPLRSVSSKATRTLIRKHHTLEKEKSKAIKNGDESKAATISQKINSQGGIQEYQRASLIGQQNDRGGDSSRILMGWMKPILSTLKVQAEKGNRLRMLEVGALSTNNACSKSRLFEMERIDLNSQGDGIKKQDFMDRPLPQDENEEFDIISLSLVLNFVPDAGGRGDMLLRTLKFLKLRQDTCAIQDCFPGLFLVLPAACVMNSRYLDEAKLESIMGSLGYVLLQKKLSNKLVYYLWRLQFPIPKCPVTFRKVEIRSGKTRNNFAVVLK